MRKKHATFSGEKLRALREERGLNQTTLAARAGVHRSTLSNLEKDQQVPQYATARRLADALDVPLSEIFSRENLSYGSQNFQKAYPFSKALTSERLSLAHWLARESSRRLADHDDLFQEGFWGLFLYGWGAYDPLKNDDFDGWADAILRWAIRNEARRRYSGGDWESICATTEMQMLEMHGLDNGYLEEE